MATLHELKRRRRENRRWRRNRRLIDAFLQGGIDLAPMPNIPSMPTSGQRMAAKIAAAETAKEYHATWEFYRPAILNDPPQEG